MESIKNKEIIVAYSLNNEEYYMTAVSIKSLIENNTKNTIRFLFVYDELFDKKYLKDLENIKKYNNCVGVEFKNIQSNEYKNVGLTLEELCSYNYMIEIPYLFEYAKILYLDNKTLINDDILDLYKTDLTNYTCAAVIDNNSDRYIADFNLNKNLYFSSYVLLINTKKWLKDDIKSKYLNAVSKTPFNKNLYPVSATYLNMAIDTPYILDIKYNYIEFWWRNFKPTEIHLAKIYEQYKSHLKLPSILTFIGAIPISNISCSHSYLSLWWKYAEKSPIYKEIKEYRQLNKYKLTATSAQNSFRYGWLLSRIFPYIKPYLFRIFLGFLIAIPLGLLDGVTAFALKPYMDYVIGGKTLDFSILNHSINISSLAMAFILPVGVILFAAIQGVLRYLNDYISAWTSQRITNDVKFDLFHRLIHMHPQFFDDNTSGIVISRYMGDPGAASAGIVDQIKSITTDICGALGLIAVMIYSSWKLAFIGVLVLCIAFIPVALLRKRIKEASNKNMVIGGNITTNINETYTGNKVMTAYDLQDRQEEYFKDQVWKSFNINMSLTKRAAWMSPLMYLIASCGIAIVLGYGTYLINTGHMTAGSFASFVTSLLLLYKPVKGLGGTFAGIQNVFVAMGRMFELFDLEPYIKDSKNPIEMKSFNNEIKFEHVNFEYVPNQLVLKDLNLTIKKNETLAIVGNSGGGKSTLVNLLPRFYDIKSGSIKFDNTDIKTFSLKSLRQNISMVFQDNFLYSGTIKENIMMGNPNATTEELMAAIKSAHLEDMIQELPEGLETKLGERGLTLSGGQRQRVAIARAMLRNAPIVILDEATSALDNESEAIVQKAMDNLMQNRTVFIIAHRLSTIKNADRIAVINEGELVELGTHDELINIEDGQYKHLYEMQFKKQEVRV